MFRDKPAEPAMEASGGAVTWYYGLVSEKDQFDVGLVVRC